MSKLLRTIRRLRNPRDLWLFLQILFLLILLPRRIRRLSLPALLADLDPGVGPGPPDEARLEKTVGFIDSLLKYRLFQRYGKCLLRSLVLFRFLRLQGWPVEIKFGVRRTGENENMPGRQTKNAGITGHSWLILEDEPFLETEQQHTGYFTTFSFPS